MNHDARALASPCADVEGPADEHGPLAHAEQANRSRIADVGFGDATAVVANPKLEGPRTLGQRHMNGARLRVPHDVRERFLENPEQRRLLFLAEGGPLFDRAYVTADTGARAEADGFPPDRRWQTEMIEGRRPKLGGQPLHRLDADFNETDERLQPVDGLRGDALLDERVDRSPELEFHGRQRLPELVVELPSERGSFVLAGGLDSCRQKAKLFLRFLESALGLARPGNIDVAAGPAHARATRSNSSSLAHPWMSSENVHECVTTSRSHCLRSYLVSRQYGTIFVQIVRQSPTVAFERLADITGVHEQAKRLMTERTALQRWRHDLKNQLGIVLGFSELLLGELEEGSRFRPDVAEIQKAAARALDLVGQMPVGTDRDENSPT